MAVQKVKHRDFPGRPGVKNSPPSAGGEGSIPGRGAKIPYASRPKNQHIKQKQYCNKFNKDFKKMVHIKKKKSKKKKSRRLGNNWCQHEKILRKLSISDLSS